MPPLTLHYLYPPATTLSTAFNGLYALYPSYLIQMLFVKSVTAQT
jgi:hypothetical protein